ncbi:MAG: DUF2066 domain-containing protein [Pseudomonadota bacterium]
MKTRTRGIRLGAFLSLAVVLTLPHPAAADTKPRQNLTVLVWLAARTPTDVRWMSPDIDVDLWAAAKSAAADSGFEALHPLLDLEDQGSLPVADVVRRIESTVRSASLRYAPDAVLSGYQTQGDGQWQMDWLLLRDTQVRRWTTRASDPAGALRQGLENAAQMLTGPRASAAGRESSAPATGTAPGAPAVAGGQASAEPRALGDAVLARVAGVSGPKDYLRVMQALRSTPEVGEFAVETAQGDVLMLRVRPVTSLSAMAEGLEANPVLQGEPSGSGDATRAVSLYFRLLP